MYTFSIPAGFVCLFQLVGLIHGKKHGRTLQWCRRRYNRSPPGWTAELSWWIPGEGVIQYMHFPGHFAPTEGIGAEEWQRISLTPFFDRAGWRFSACQPANEMVFKLDLVRMLICWFVDLFDRKGDSMNFDMHSIWPIDILSCIETSDWTLSNKNLKQKQPSLKSYSNQSPQVGNSNTPLIWHL